MTIRGATATITLLVEATAHAGDEEERLELGAAVDGFERPGAA